MQDSNTGDEANKVTSNYACIQTYEKVSEIRSKELCDDLSVLVRMQDKNAYVEATQTTTMYGCIQTCGNFPKSGPRVK